MIEAMKQMANYIDSLGGDSKKYRQALEQAEKSNIKQVIHLYDKPPAAPVQKPVAWRYNGKLHEFDPSDWATGPVTPLYTSPPAKPWVNPSLKEYEDIMLANITPRTNDERDGIMGALSDMVVLLQEKNA